jgi:hypothetical protein
LGADAMESIGDTVIVIMSKNKETGFLEKEIGNYTVSENDNFIVNVYALEEAGLYKVHIKISTDKEVEDWEFSAIYDYYDDEAIKTLVTEIIEIEDCYNPTWEVVFDFIDSQQAMEDKIEAILECHKNELLEVYETIKDKKSEYVE